MLPALSKQETMTAWALLLKGGWVMVPILFLSILVVYVIIERMIVLKKEAKVPKKWFHAISTHIHNKDIQGAKLLCAQKNNAIKRIIGIGIEKLSYPRKHLEAAVEHAGQREVYKLEKNLSLLGTMAGAAPMMGFLGTVLGMIQTFMAIAQAATHVSPQLLSGGMYEAMITTAAGLIVGIVAYLGYNYLLTCIQQATQQLEQTSRAFIELAEVFYDVKQNQASE